MPEKPKKFKHAVQVKLDDKLIEYIKKDAEENERTFGGSIRFILYKYLKLKKEEHEESSS